MPIHVHKIIGVCVYQNAVKELLFAVFQYSTLSWISVLPLLSIARKAQTGQVFPLESRREAVIRECLHCSQLLVSVGTSVNSP